MTELTPITMIDQRHSGALRSTAMSVESVDFRTSLQTGAETELDEADKATISEANSLTTEIYDLIFSDPYEGMTTFQIFQKELLDARNPLAALQDRLSELKIAETYAVGFFHELSNEPKFAEAAEELGEATEELQKEVATLETQLAEAKRQVLQRAGEGSDPSSVWHS